MIRRPPRTGCDRDRGAVTVEAAVALGSLLVVFVLVLAGVRAVAGQLRCTDAAGAIARLLARGEWQRVDQVLERLAPSGARLAVRSTGRTVTVTVVSEPFETLLPDLELRARTYAVLEPEVGAPPASLGSADERD